MNQYQIKVTYSVINSEEITVVKSMPFLIPSSTLEAALSEAESTAIPYINRVNGTFISAEQI